MKNARAFGLDSAAVLDDRPVAVERKVVEGDAEVPVAMDSRLAGLIFKHGGKRPRFSNVFRSGTLLPTPEEVREAESSSKSIHRLMYRLRRYRVRKKKHPKAIVLVEDQREDFHRRKIANTGMALSQSASRTGSMEFLSGVPSGLPSGQASRYRILGQLRYSASVARKTSARMKALEALLSKVDGLSSVAEPTRMPHSDVLMTVKIDEHRLHPVETTMWEEQIVFDEQDAPATDWEARKLTPKFIEVRQLPPRSSGLLPTYQAAGSYASAIASLLASRSASGVASPFLTRSPAPASSLPQLLKRPRSEATRVTNAALEEGSWADAIIWDEGEPPKKLPHTRLILDLNDPYMPLEIVEKDGADGVGGMNLRDLQRLSKAINKAKAKKAAAASTPTPAAPPPIKAVNYAKIQSSDKFNLSNDKHYEVSTATADAATNVSSATRRSMMKSSMAVRIGLQHSVPAVKLIAPFFRTGWSRSELRNWHKPVIQQPLEVNWIFSALTKAGKEQKTSGLASQVLRNAKKLGIRDGSEFVLIEYSEENPLLLSNPGMASFLHHVYRKTSPKDAGPPLDPEWGTLRLLEPTDDSLFWNFGDVPAGQVLPVLQNNLFKSPIFQHSSSPQDFLAIRSHIKGKAGSKLYLRALPNHLLLVGQEFPTMEIPGPHSRAQNQFAKDRVKAFCYRLFAKDTTAAQTGRPRLKIARVLAAFPQYSEGSIRKWLKEYAESVRGGDAGIWQRKEDAPVLSEDDLRQLITPEMICANEAMLVGQQRLQDAGFDLGRGADKAIDDEALEDDPATMLEAEEAAGEAQMAPWVLSANVRNSMFTANQTPKVVLQLRTPGDTASERGDHFSFARMPSKIPDDGAPGAKRQRPALDMAAYKQDIAKIWAAQLKSLSDPNPPADLSTGEGAGAGDVAGNASSIWTDIMRGTKEDDELSTTAASQTAASATVHSERSRRRLVVTRTLRTEDGSQVVETETLDDPLLIQAYLKERRQMDSRLRRRQQMAAASAARAAQRPVKQPAAPKPPREPAPPKPKKFINIRCSACGVLGHMRTNRICPFYEQYEASQAESSAVGSLRSSESAVSLVDPGAVRVQGTKISIAKATLDRVASKPGSITVGQQRALSQFSLFLQDVCAALVAMPLSWPFRKPVAKKEYPHYYRMIAKPIDLGTIRSRAKRQIYRTLDAFLADVRLLADNCAQFNLEDHPFTGMARQLVTEAESMAEQKKEQIEHWMADLRSHPKQPTEVPADQSSFIESGRVSTVNEEHPHDEEAHDDSMMADDASISVDM